MQKVSKSTKFKWKDHSKVKNNPNFLKLVIHNTYYKELPKDMRRNLEDSKCDHFSI